MKKDDRQRAKLAIHLFGPPEIYLDGDLITDLPSKALALLSYVAVMRRPQQRTTLASLLWGEVPEQNARANLRKAIQRLKSALPDHLDVEQQSIVLREGASIWVDVTEFEQRLSKAVTTDDVQVLSTATQLYRGDFLAGFHVRRAPDFEAWHLSQQTLLRDKLIYTLQKLSQLLTDQQRLEPAIDAIRRVVELEPWREDAHRHLIELLARSGDRAAALAQYEECCAALATELDAEPGTATRELAEQIRSGEYEAVDIADQTRSHPKISGSTKTDLSGMPESGNFFGRERELAQLQQWITKDTCRLCAILGVGGMGKTSLAAAFVASLLPANRPVSDSRIPFDKIIWISLLNAPTLNNVFHQCISFLSDQQIIDVPPTLDDQLNILTSLFQRQHCLLVLDNVESVMAVGNRTGSYRAGYEGYGQLFQRVAQSTHRSCLLLTSRESPHGFTRLERDLSAVCSLDLKGLSDDAAQQLLMHQGLITDAADRITLAERYSGHPLALKLVAETVDELYLGDVDAFLAHDAPIFADIHDVLDQTFSRLSLLEQEIMIWLAIVREPVTVDMLESHLLGPVTRRDYLDSMRALQKRSLLERLDTGFSLQNVIMEYTTAYLIEKLHAELLENSLESFNRYALLQAQAPDHIRESQRRLILQPLVDRLTVALGRIVLETYLQAMPSRLRANMPSGYAAGNMLNMAYHMELDLSGWDFSELSIWQADLQRLDVQDLNFSGAQLQGVAFTDSFGYVTAVDVSPNGQQIAFGTADGELRILRRRDGQTLNNWKAHRTRINTVGFCAAGRLLASTGSDRTLHVWDVSNGQHLMTLSGHTLPVTSAHFSPDGRWLVSSSRDETIRLWDVDKIVAGKTAQMLKTVYTDTAPVVAVRFSPDGHIIASSNTDKVISLWDPVSGQVRQWLAAANEVEHANQLRFSPSGRELAGNYGSAVCLWDLASGEIYRRLQRRDAGVFSIDITPDGKTLFSADNEGRIRKWNVESGEVLQTLHGHTQRIHSIRLCRDGEMLASGSWDRSVRLWQAGTGRLLQVWRGYSNRIWSICFNPAGTLLASANERRTVHLWDVESGQVRHTLSGHTDWVMSVCFSPDGKSLVSGSGDRTIRHWDVTTGQCRQVLQGHMSQVRALSFSPDGGALLSGSGDQMIHLRKIDKRDGSISSEPDQIVAGHEGAVWAISYDRSGRLAASSSADQTIRLWDMADPDSIVCLLTLHGHEGGVGTVAFSPDRPLLASGCGDQTIRLWDIDNPGAPGRERLLTTLHGHSDWVNSICFSPDGQLLASGGADHVVCLWDVASGERLRSIGEHTDRVWAVTFSPDGRLLASGSADGTIRLWDVKSGSYIRTLRPDRPYERTNIRGVTGITDAQRETLKALGAVEK